MTKVPTQAPSWVSSFYDPKGQASGPSGVLDHHRERAAAVKQLGGKSHGRVLELGAGSGGSAVATAELGYRVVAVELSPVRAGFASDLPRDRAGLTIEVIEADLTTVELSDKFDVVTCWNGFGVGTDADQRGLLNGSATTGWPKTESPSSTSSTPSAGPASPARAPSTKRPGGRETQERHRDLGCGARHAFGER